MKLIPLTQGRSARIDDEDLIHLSKWNWHAHQENGQWYAKRWTRKSEGSPPRYISMHSFLLGCVADHRNGDGLDNQRQNLRPATKRQNARGFRRKRKGCSSQFRGVSWCQNAEQWRARIVLDGIETHIGLFAFEIDAARAYDEEAHQHFGEFAQANFPVVT